MTHLIYSMQGRTVEDQTLAFRKDSVELPAGTEKYLKLMVVREPLTRLVSGYHNKLTDSKKHEKLVTQISNKTSRKYKLC